MGFLDYFRSEKKRSASVAKERLQIIVARERGARGGPDYLPQLQEELLAVIRKYVQVSDDAVRMEVEHEGNCDVLELNITLPEPEEGHRASGS
ncbi:cell division topological specificity factor MinE [Arhodomonas sp. SL1]|uniref:cell division topological specificity factor MinE n=1 Tax=Arhodomonas sp. SL1 TaxID=3425691 RepID=UPI003F88117A